VIVGTTNSFGPGDFDIWLIKTDSLGDTIWTNTLGDSASDEGATSIQETQDGGYIIAGTKDTAWVDVFLVKTNQNGNVLWSKTYGGIADDWASSVIQTIGGKTQQKWPVGFLSLQFLHYICGRIFN
jgi:hypothetical protein